MAFTGASARPPDSGLPSDGSICALGTYAGLVIHDPRNWSPAKI